MNSKELLIEQYRGEIKNIRELAKIFAETTIQEKMRKPKNRQCSVCGEVKPLSEFYTYKYKGRKYTRGFCNA